MATPYAFIRIFANAVCATGATVSSASIFRASRQGAKKPGSRFDPGFLRMKQRPVDSSLAAFYFVRVTLTVVVCTTLPDVPVTVMA